MTAINNQPIKILLITHYYPNHRGGVEIVAGKLAEYLLKIGEIKITWLASNVDEPPSDIDSLQCLPMSAFNGIEEKLQLPYPVWSFSALLTLWKQVQQTDIIHIHDYLYMSNLAAFIFAKLQKKPLIITQHIGFIPYDNPVFRILLSFLNSTLGCWVLRYSDRAIFISDVVQKYFSDKTTFRRPALLLPNGVDTNIFMPTDEATRKQYRQELNLPLDKPVFLFVGRFVEKKGLLILQQLAQNFPNIHWLFAGWGALDPTAWQLPNVTILHNLREAQLTPIYQAADLLILPSKGEGFPLVVQEAMTCGTPVMVGTETAQACKAAEHLMFSEQVACDDGVSRWSAKIQTLLENPEQLQELREQVANFAQSYWSWKKTSADYYEIFTHTFNQLSTKK